MKPLNWILAFSVLVALTELTGCASHMAHAPSTNAAQQSIQASFSNPNELSNDSNSAVASQTAPSIATQWPLYQAQLADLKRWQVQGKLGLRLPDQSGSVYFTWRHQDDDFAIYLNGPLGQGGTWIRGNTNQVELENSDGLIRASSAEQLMFNQLGWWLPVSDLYYWARALPVPGAETEQLTRNADGTLAQLQQRGWLLQYSRYHNIDGFFLPQKIKAQRPQDNITLIFIMKNWQLY